MQLRIAITEPTAIENTKSIGCWYIENSVLKAGFSIQYIAWDNIKKSLKENLIDVLLLSFHHVRDLDYIKGFVIPDKVLVVAGGHVMNNPYPFIEYCDIAVIGEGEEWIIKVLSIHNEYKDKAKTINECIGFDGTLSKANIDKPVQKIFIENLSNVENLYLNKSNEKGHKDTWYLEMGRGCKSKCNYCELGWSSKFREFPYSNISERLNCIDKSISNNINVYAPDDFSISYYDQVVSDIATKGLNNKFGSMRLDNFENVKIKHKKNFLFRIGLDGLSEQIRFAVNKRLKNSDVINWFDSLIEQGLVQFKMFCVFSYPFETINDFNEFLSIIQQLKNKARRLSKPVWLRLKFTPLIPNFFTPFERFYPRFDHQLHRAIEHFFVDEKIGRSNIIIQNDGILMPFNYYKQAFLARASYKQYIDTLAFNKVDYSQIRTTIEHNLVQTPIPSRLRDKAFHKMIKNFQIPENYYWNKGL